VVDVVDSYYITLRNTLTNIYDVDDEITGAGTALAAGWDIGGRKGLPSYPGNIWVPQGIIYPLNVPYSAAKSITGPNLIFGKSDRYRQYLSWNASDGYGNSANDPYIERSYGDVLLGGTIYRFGAFVKGYGTSMAACVDVNDGVSDFISGFSLLTSTSTEWTEKTTTGTCSHVPQPSDCIITIYAEDEINGQLFIDDIYLEHAKMTDDEDYGVYTFTEVPLIDSEKVENVSETEFILQRMPSGRGFRYQESGTGDKVEKFVISMDFENVDPDFYKNIRLLREWQRYGYNLIFHPHSSLASQTKSVIFCNMTISNFTYKHWDRTRPSFTLTFEEI
jgi:hypothetical protein